MSGSNSICVSTVLLATGIIPMVEPETRMALEAPGGVIDVTATCRDGRAERISVRNVPSFAARLDVLLDVPGLGTLKVDTAYGGDSFVIVDAAALGLDLGPDSARTLAELGMRITAAVNRQSGFHHPDNPDWTHISFCLFTTPVELRDGVRTAPHWWRSGRARLIAHLPALHVPPGWRCCMRGVKWRWETAMSRVRSSVRNSTAISTPPHAWAIPMQSFPLFQAAHGLPARSS